MAKADSRTHPLRSWKLRNFKSIAQADLKLAPLNVVVGPNSSGKSSLLQSILLFVQAVQAQAYGANFPLNGPLVSLGNFTDVLTVGAESQETVIGGELASSEGQSSWRRYTPWSFYGRGRTTVDWEIGLSGKADNEPGAAKISYIAFEGKLEQAGNLPQATITLNLRRSQ